MKLFELLQPINEIPLIRLPKKLSEEQVERILRGDVDAQFLGSGITARVFGSKQKPGTVRRIARYTPDDGYFKYLTTMLSKNRHVNNPYLPVIYDVKMFRLPIEGVNRDIRMYAVEMEKLVDAGEVNKKFIQATAEKIFDFDFLRQNKMPTNFINENELAEVLDYFADGRLNIKGIKDPDLKRALYVIKTAINDIQSAQTDIHGGNIMFRRTSVGLQLVITDPIY